ncbi:M16 family metallopeptidase [Flavobacterium pallidum]|uniref:Peptidase M16 n=1 Tax=Flavobacterium pallidum TaxID=2172098 RepID=A0A2S1SER9_9FLAO|nr:pitrilysin family protein [Flavobacterium pallidum]AWI24864.1 peptidase M16 [Flavobacterium pallidum]
MQGQIIPQPKPGPSPSIKINKPETFELKNGLKVMVVENHKLPRVSFSLSIDNAPYAEGNKKGVADMASALIGEGTTKISKDAFNEEIDFLGANVSFGASGAFASSLSKYAGRVLELMADGALNPNFTQEEFDKQKAKIIEGLKSDEKSVPAVAERVKGVLTYGKSHPSGEYLSEETLNNVTLADVKQNYNTYFVPGNAYLVIVGDVKLKDVKKTVEKLFGSWKAATAPSISYTDPKDVQYSQINFVDMPNAVQSEVAAINISNLKMTDPDYFAVIVANQILGGDFNSYINMNLREAHGWTYGARSAIGGDKYVSNFEASTQVRNAVTDSTVVEMFKEIKRIRTEKVSDEMLSNVKAGYVGRFVMQVEKPQTIATYALRTRTQGLPDDFYENYIKNINAVTADDVMRVANKYFLADNMRVIIVGKGSDVLPGLEKLKMPILYFDKYGNKTDKPASKKEVPAGVTTKTVLDNYIKAIGGEKAAKAVKTVLMTGTTELPGAPSPLAFTLKVDVKGKSSVELAMGPMSIMKQVVGDKEGYQVQQGQKMAMEADEFKDAKASAVPFEELTLLTSAEPKLTGIEPINGNDAYALQANADTVYYYDLKSGLKVAEAKTQENEGQKMTLMTYFNDYKDVKGLKFPFNIVKNVGIELDIKFTDIKINEGVTDADFQ